MKATFEIPDELYREVKAETAREGRSMREVAIHLFESWLRQRKMPPSVPAVDWSSYRAPLASPAFSKIKDHSLDAMRESIARHRSEKN